MPFNSAIHVDRSFKIDKSKFCPLLQEEPQHIHDNDDICEVAQLYISQSSKDLDFATSSLMVALDIVTSHAKRCFGSLKIDAYDLDVTARQSFLQLMKDLEKSGSLCHPEPTDASAPPTDDSAVDAHPSAGNVVFKESIVDQIEDFDVALDHYRSNPSSIFFYASKQVPLSSLQKYFQDHSFSLYLLGTRNIYPITGGGKCLAALHSILAKTSSKGNQNYAFVAFSPQNPAARLLVETFPFVTRDHKVPYPKFFSRYQFRDSEKCHIVSNVTEKDIPSLASVAQSNGWEIVTSSDDRAYYLSFLPTMARWWKKHGLEVNLAFVTNKQESHPVVHELKKYAKIHLFRPVAGIPEGNQGKLARSFLAAHLDQSKVYTIADLDLYLLRMQYLENALKCVPQDSLLAIGENLYDPRTMIDRARPVRRSLPNPRDTTQGKFPIYYSSAQGSVWKEIINPNGDSWEEFPMSLKSMMFDALENAFHQRRGFSDESLLRKLLFDWSIRWENRFQPRVISMKRVDNKPAVLSRLDRSKWPKSISQSQLRQRYVDVFPVRPFYQTYTKLGELMKYMDVMQEDQVQEWLDFLNDHYFV
eukprot:TRINITY_DN10576_c0_g1_i3.p1 TRINITY_DN10576_c0_g1~~TRINITY_DN10576_c0_g1_i3.p1  ORF type:complete len:587 (+),score=127.97 TRINITY_DN10576_c0_g1_i3:114-1874(+)